MRENILMRVLFCKFHCPFICFCKPSATHLYNHGTLKLENSPNASSLAVSGSDNSVKQFTGETSEIKEEENVEVKQERVIVLRSCIKKVVNGADSPVEVEQKRVQWVDHIGKELVEIKEFESSETGDNYNEDEGRGCVCIIL